MTDPHDIRVTLQHFAQNISRWREEASRLRIRAKRKGGRAIVRHPQRGG